MKRAGKASRVCSNPVWPNNGTRVVRYNKYVALELDEGWCARNTCNVVGIVNIQGSFVAIENIYPWYVGHESRPFLFLDANSERTGHTLLKHVETGPLTAHRWKLLRLVNIHSAVLDDVLTTPSSSLGVLVLVRLTLPPVMNAYKLILFASHRWLETDFLESTMNSSQTVLGMHFILAIILTLFVTIAHTSPILDTISTLDTPSPIEFPTYVVSLMNFDSSRALGIPPVQENLPPLLQSPPDIGPSVNPRPASFSVSYIYMKNDLTQCWRCDTSTTKWLISHAVLRTTVAITTPAHQNQKQKQKNAL